MTILTLISHFGYVPHVRIFSSTDIIYDGADLGSSLDYLSLLVKDWVIAPNGTVDIIVYGGNEL